MILVLAEPADLSAIWLGTRLRPRVGDVQIVTPAQLIYAPSIVQRLSTDDTAADVRLATGITIDLAAAKGIVNRLRTLPVEHLRAANAVERSYAESELYAFILGFLAALPCPIFNAPTPQSLCGPTYSWIHSRELAAKAGLVSSPAVCSEALLIEPTEASAHGATIFVLDGKLIGPLVAPPLRDMLISFAALWGGRLLQIDLAADRTFLGATSFVDYRLGGDVLVGAIARALTA